MSDENRNETRTGSRGSLAQKLWSVETERKHAREHREQRSEPGGGGMKQRVKKKKRNAAL